MTKQGKRVAVLTGASRGLGKVMALALARDGVRLALTSTRPGGLDDVIAQSGLGDEDVLAIDADLERQDEIDKVLDRTRAKFGQIDIMINNGAVLPPHFWPDWEIKGEPVPWAIDRSIYERFLKVNVVAPHILNAAVIPEMLERGWGRIINLTTSLDTMMRFWPYGSTKAAMEAYTGVLAKALEGSGVTANTFIPGGLAKDEPIRDDQGNVIRAVLSPEIMAAPIRFLVDNASDGINGRRFIASQWDTALPPYQAVAAATLPIAWNGPTAIVPDVAA